MGVSMRRPSCVWTYTAKHGPHCLRHLPVTAHAPIDSAAATESSWTVTSGANLAVRQWGEECLVHHALSNDTHRLSAWAAEVLFELAEAGPTSASTLSRQLAMTQDEVLAVLTTLAQLDLVGPC